jgi:hypothetical protein
MQTLTLPLVLVQGLNATLGIVECFTGYLEPYHCTLLRMPLKHSTMPKVQFKFYPYL